MVFGVDSVGLHWAGYPSPAPAGLGPGHVGLVDVAVREIQLLEGHACLRHELASGHEALFESRSGWIWLADGPLMAEHMGSNFLENVGLRGFS